MVGIITLIRQWNSVMLGHRRMAFRKVGVPGVAMAANHMTTHEVMHYTAVQSGVVSEYSDRIYS